MADNGIPKADRDHVRELARRYMELATSPEMAARKQLWTDHNALKDTRPPIVFETWSIADDITPPLTCESAQAQQIECRLTSALVSEEMIGDDKVFAPYFTVGWRVRYDVFDVTIEREFRKDDRGVDFGFRLHHPIQDITTGLAELKPGGMSVDREATLAGKARVEDVLCDIMPVKITGPGLPGGIPNHTFSLLGMEYMLLSMVDHPKEIHALHRRICDSHLAYIDWLEAEGLLTLNNEYDQVPSGGYGCTDELPAADFAERDHVLGRDLWCHISAQETVGISPAMYGEFVYPYYCEIAERVGRVSYACCEPVDKMWDGYLQHLPNLRAVGVTRWCDEDVMGQALRGHRFIYTRKPDPTFVGTGDFDAEAFGEHITRTLTAARGCHVQFVYRDVYTLCGERDRARKAVQVIRDMIDKHG